MKPSTLALCLLVLTSGLLAQPLTDARKAMDAKDFEKAVEILEADWDNVKADSKGLTALVEATLNAGMYDRCMTYSARLVDLDPKQPAGYRLGAQAFYWRAEEAKQETGATPGKINGLYEEARSLTASYLDLKNDDAEMWSLLGHTCYWLSDHEASAKAFEKCASFEPKNTGHLTFLSRAWRLAGKLEEAAKAMDRAIALDPENGALIKAKADVLWAKAEKSKANADYSAAGDVYGAAMIAKNTDVQTGQTCANFIAAVAAKVGDYGPAIKHIKAWVAAGSNDPNRHWYLGWFERTNKNEQGALDAYKKSWDVSGKTLASGAVGVALSYRRLAYPTDASGQPDMSKKPDVKKLEEAMKWYCKAQGVKGWNWNGKQNEPVNQCVSIFLACANGGALADGARMLEEYALKAAPDNWQVLNNLGLYYRDTGGGRRDKALCKKSLDYYKRASDLVLKDPDATNESKARVLNDTGVLFHFPQYFTKDIETGMKYYQRALTYQPESHKDAIGWYDAHENMGLCMNTLGKYEEAIPFFKKVLEREPGRRMSRMGLGRAERELKDK